MQQLAPDYYRGVPMHVVSTTLRTALEDTGAQRGYADADAGAVQSVYAFPVVTSEPDAVHG